jgi:hypothetical protein
MEQTDIILDQKSPVLIPSEDLKKSLIVLWIYAGEAVLLTLTALAGGFFPGTVFVDMLTAIAGLGLMIIIAISPFGIFYSFKAFRKKEGNSKARVRHLMGHALVFTIGVAMILFYIRGGQN